MLATESLGLVHQRAATSYANVGPTSNFSSTDGVAPGWDGQIMPALKKRLETESAFLTHRLSVAQSDKHPSSSGIDGRLEGVATFPEHSRESHFHKGNTQVNVGNTQVNVPPKVEGRTGLSSRPTPQSSPRSRTKSGPMVGPSEASKKRVHDLESDDDAQLRDLNHLELDPHIVSGASQEMGLAEGKGEKRKRAVTLKTSGRNRRVAARSSNKDREPDFERPVFGNPSLNVAKPRIQTGSTPPAAATSYPISQTSRSISMKAFSSTPRTSPSHNTLPNSHSRLGVAAHLIPPESTCKPPEGANWDEVVLPAVAKKLGIKEARSIDKVDSEPDAEDLAVEWDKDGTPIKWVKKKMEDRTPLDKQTDFQTKSPNSELMGLRFNPTLEPSPDSPFRQSNYDTPRLDTLELSPQHEAPGPYTTPPLLLKTISQTSIALKSSLLKKASMQGITKPPSLRSVQGVSPAQPPTSGATDAVYEKGMDKHSGVTSVKANLSGVSNVQSEKAMGSRPNKKAKEDSHSKGCGCAVM
ncbi:hypothetical protein L804_01267 [Cryptococcus deuterogattii 2001/935-1]|nr:hypothetical protein L804_01267 [Cryptococcus deuterogattii 2001/935-1]